jgi:hypothetical protein
MGTKNTPLSESPLDIRMVDLADIIIPTEYQREFNQAKADKMIENFKEEKVGVLPLTDRGEGKFAATDAMHRIYVLKALGYKQWPAQIMTPRSVAKEARVFVDLQIDRTALTGRSKWRARRVAEEPVVLAVEAVVEGLGLEIAVDKKRTWRAVQATSALEKIYTAMGERMLTDTLRMAGNAWPENKDSFKSPVILGIASFLLYYRDDPTFRRDDVVDKWGSFPLKRILQSASELSSAIGGGSGATYNKGAGLSWSPGMVSALVHAYNYKRSTRQIELPTLSGWKAVNKRYKAEASAKEEALR